MKKDKIEVEGNLFGDGIPQAIDVALAGLLCDGSHHKQWFLDQVVRVLTGCPYVQKTITDINGKPHTYRVLGESEDYLKLVKDSEDEGLDWDVGCPP